MVQEQLPRDGSDLVFAVSPPWSDMVHWTQFFRGVRRGAPERRKGCCWNWKSTEGRRTPRAVAVWAGAGDKAVCTQWTGGQATRTLSRPLFHGGGMHARGEASFQGEGQLAWLSCSHTSACPGSCSYHSLPHIQVRVRFEVV